MLSTTGLDLCLGEVIILRRKRWRPYILPQYHASLRYSPTEKYKESHIFAVFFTVRTTLCILGLRVLVFHMSVQ